MRNWLVISCRVGMAVLDLAGRKIPTINPSKKLDAFTHGTKNVTKYPGLDAC